jgi:hypothetical protein
MEINYVCSLGSLCHTASILQRNNIKLVSYPFDWIFSNYNNVIHCIEDNFNIFLDKSYYRHISDSECGHSLYDKTLCNPMWRHHNPLCNEDHYQYIQRCVNRFQHLLKCNGNKLFIITFVNFVKMDEKIIIDILEFNNKLSKYTKNYILLIIFHIPNKDTINANHIFKIIGNIHFLQLNTKSESAGTYFHDDSDNIYLDNLIKHKYNFNLHKS